LGQVQGGVAGVAGHACGDVDDVGATISPVAPQARAVLIASATNAAAPRAEAALPARSRAAAITGAEAGVEIVASSGCRPRSRTL